MTASQNEPNRFVQSDLQSENMAATRDQLLAQVLGETLSRRHEDPDTLLQWLCQWRTTLSNIAFGPELCELLVEQVLQYRMGADSGRIPIPLRQNVAAALWNDPESRRRIDRLWQSLETDQ
ncbi:hypothetical protein CA13_37860 [Planctomycetes bacterium CA13]|uniref:Uncharacterized protein n=1 Tax=Novipirellula herctigrandis TaxID=2527986 RepID=A0A5C5Z4Z6_9BACT|nr:hypothetical protein CA13_37860 [Planctomycetes bacterium CA13]